MGAKDLETKDKAKKAKAVLVGPFSCPNEVKDNFVKLCEAHDLGASEMFRKMLELQLQNDELTKNVAQLTALIEKLSRG